MRFVVNISVIRLVRPLWAGVQSLGRSFAGAFFAASDCFIRITIRYMAAELFVRAVRRGSIRRINDLRNTKG